MKKAVICVLLTICVALTVMAGGSKESSTDTSKGTGTIIFTANGEDFVRQGFIDKQNWHITFDNVYVTIKDPIAYTPDGKEEVKLAGVYTVDLAEGPDDADPIVIGKIENAAPANYQSLRFSIKRSDSGAYKGYSIVMVGTASKNGDEVDFTIKLDEEMDFDGKEGFVGDEIKGMLNEGESTDVEMTFHFDHVFGDIEASADDHINTGSVGFDFFNRFAKNGKVEVSQSELGEEKEYKTLVEALWTLGHLGEGHCEVSNQSSKGKI